MNTGLQTGRTFQRLLINVVEIKYFERFKPMTDGPTLYDHTCMTDSNGWIVWFIETV